MYRRLIALVLRKKKRKKKKHTHTHYYCYIDNRLCYLEQLEHNHVSGIHFCSMFNNTNGSLVALNNISDDSGSLHAYADKVDIEDSHFIPLVPGQGEIVLSTFGSSKQMVLSTFGSSKQLNGHAFLIAQK